MTTRVVSWGTKIGAHEDAVYVGRPTKWGNPFSHRANTAARYRVRTLSESLNAYEEWAWEHLREDACRELRGKILSCFCTTDLTGKELIICHAQILARIADGRKRPIMRCMP